MTAVYTEQPGRDQSAESERVTPALQNATLARAGFTLIELVFVVQVLGFLVLIMINETRNTKEHAMVRACMGFQVAMQRQLWSDYALTGLFPANADPFIAATPSGKLTKDFTYTQTDAGGAYYLRCDHNHAFTAVLFCDSGSYLPPKAIYNLASARGP